MQELYRWDKYSKVKSSLWLMHALAGHVRWVRETAQHAHLYPQSPFTIPIC